MTYKNHKLVISGIAGAAAGIIIYFMLRDRRVSNPVSLIFAAIGIILVTWFSWTHPTLYISDAYNPNA